MQNSRFTVGLANPIWGRSPVLGSQPRSVDGFLPHDGQLFRNRINEWLGKTPREPSAACAATLAEYTRGKPLLHGERRRRRHILPFDEQFSLGAAGARQRDLEGFDRR
jgi:hypothetical protein